MGVFDIGVIENITMPKKELTKITEHIENGLISNDEISKNMRRIKKILTPKTIDNYKTYINARLDANENNRGMISKKDNIVRLNTLKLEVDNIKTSDLVAKRSRKVFRR